jgi:ribonuclease HI
MSRVVYTDGACRGNPGPGGWAWAVDRETFASGHDPHTTNQRMELTAAAEAVATFSGPLEIRSDSTYVVNCFNQGWWRGWHKRGWKNSKREAVANRDLWEPFIDTVLERGDVTFTWVKGHSGDAMNDVADELAVKASFGEESGRSRVPLAKGSVGLVDPSDLDLRLFED